MKVVEKENFEKTLNLPNKTIITDGELIKRESFFIESLQDGSKFNIANKKNMPNHCNVNISEIPMPISEKITPTNIINKVLKDVIARYSILKGNYVNHNLGFFHTDKMLKQIQEEPKQDINKQLNNQNGAKKTNLPKKTGSPNFSHIKKEFGILEKNKINLEKNIRNQIYEISNLGTMINYSKHHYSTLKLNISNEMLEKFAKLYQNGAIYSEKRPVTWCTHCGKSANSSDIKYRKSKVKNTYFLCKIAKSEQNLEKFGDLNQVFLVCSTIRPWTLLHSDRLVIATDSKFSLVEVEDIYQNTTRYIIGSEYVSHVMEDAFFIKYRTVEEFDSSLLKNMIVFHPFLEDKTLQIYSIDKKFVEIDKRNMTGINLIGKADSYLDFLINKELNVTQNYNCVIDAKGNFNNFIMDYKGQNYKEVNEKIIALLKEKEMLFLDINTVIVIPRCKVCNGEITYRYLNKWYLRRNESLSDSLKTSFDELLKRITFDETDSYKKMESGFHKILDKKELSISNERKSSVPVPAFYCANCGHEIISEFTIDICKKILKEKGIDTWNKMTPEEILSGQVKCDKCDCDFLFKEDSSLNDWFKLLTIPLFHVKTEDEEHICDNKTDSENIKDIPNQIIKNYCIETRKEFLNKLRVISFDTDAIQKINSIDHVIIHTQVKENVKTIAKPLFFHKSDNELSSNFITTDLGIIDIVKKYGIDVLRLWAVYRSNNPTIKLTEGDIINVRNMYIQFRKTVKYILSNLYDFNPVKDSIPLEKRDDLDIYIYSKMQQLETFLDKHYSQLNFPAIFKLLHKFCMEILQNNYFEACKYRLYITPKTGFYRRSTQTTFYDLIGILVTYLQPILPLLFEESWPYIFHTSPEEERNILLFRDTKDLEKIELTNEQKNWHKIFLLRKKILPLVHQACNKGIIKNSLEARVIITCTQADYDFIKEYYYDIIHTLNISVIVFRLGDTLKVEVKKALGVACKKCKNYSTSIGINYKYRHLCKQCADIEDSIANNTVPKEKPEKLKYIEEEHKNDDDERKITDNIEIPLPPEPEPLKFDNIEFDDRLGDKMNEETVKQIKELNQNSIKASQQNNSQTEKETLDKRELYHFENPMFLEDKQVLPVETTDSEIAQQVQKQEQEIAKNQDLKEHQPQEKSEPSNQDLQKENYGETFVEIPDISSSSSDVQENQDTTSQEENESEDKNATDNENLSDFEDSFRD